MTIEPRTDVYGKEADGSALADYVELLALADQRLTQADLADLIADNDWKVRSRELFQAIPAITDDDDEPLADAVERDLQEHPAADASRHVFDILDERASLLGIDYPFLRTGAQLEKRVPLEGRHNRYLCLLATTVAHSYRVPTAANPRELFEELVADSLAARLVLTVNMGQIGREQADFGQALEQAAGKLALQAAPDAAPRRTFANEAGVDTVSHLGWGDLRPGHWVLIGQATCGKSETWPRKIMEPTPDTWGPWLGSLVAPIPFLAVPHHIEAHHLYQLTSTYRRLVLDRLRLCPHLSSLTEAQESLLNDVLAHEVARL
jgi:hypothetical protein